eukprot:10449147-Alexandrium_andersonii.AAC.1
MLDGRANGRPDNWGPDGLAWSWGRTLLRLFVLAGVGDLFSGRRLKLALDGLRDLAEALSDPCDELWLSRL